MDSIIRKQMADEIMYQIASLIPQEYRGKYAFTTPPTMKYLRFSS